MIITECTICSKDVLKGENVLFQIESILEVSFRESLLQGF